MIGRILLLGSFVVAVLAGPGGRSALAAGPEPARLYLTTDRSQVLVLPGEPFTKLSVTNPNVADVNVISPTQILLSGKTVGVTSLVVIYPDKARHFDLVVSPAPIGATGVSAASEPHTVLVQRGGTVTEHLFARDSDRGWVELGTIKLEVDAGKK